MTKSLWDRLRNIVPSLEKKADTNEYPRPYYYSWISMDGLYHLIHDLQLEPEENEELLRYILETIHYEMLDATFSLIPEEEHETIIARMHKTNDPALLFGQYEVPLSIIEQTVSKRAEELLIQIYSILRQRD